MTALDLDTDVLEALDFQHVEPCEIGCLTTEPPQGDCDAPAAWSERASCATEGCADQVMYFCDPHAMGLRRGQAMHPEMTNSCAWCDSTDITITWAHL